MTCNHSYSKRLRGGTLPLLIGALFLCGLVPAARAADRAPIERNLLLQQQQSDSFALRNRQAAEELRARSLSRDEQAAMRGLHAQQRQEQDTLHDQQRRRLDSLRVQPETPASRAARRIERNHMEQESQMQMQRFERARPRLGTGR